MKAPFITNRQHFHSYPKNAEAAIQSFKSIHNKIAVDNTCFLVPYVMLQERVSPNKEVKMIFLGGKFHHITSTSIGNVVMSLAGYSRNDLIVFATSVMAFVALHAEYILDGLVRIDIFKDNAGKLVVNELESLEARSFSANDQINSSCERFLSEYWEKIIFRSINEFALNCK